jgi:hypothetical protein
MERKMTFVTEWLDEEARTKNGVNVTNWVVDHERNAALWIEGKHWQVRADGDYSETVMLKIGESKFRFELMPSDSFRSYKNDGNIHIYIWDRVIDYWPKDLGGYTYNDLMAIVKEALMVKGGGFLDNQEHPNYSVQFNF